MSDGDRSTTTEALAKALIRSLADACATAVPGLDVVFVPSAPDLPPVPGTGAGMPGQSWLAAASATAAGSQGWVALPDGAVRVLDDAPPALLAVRDPAGEPVRLANLAPLEPLLRPLAEASKLLTAARDDGPQTHGGAVSDLALETDDTGRIRYINPPLAAAVGAMDRGSDVRMEDVIGTMEADRFRAELAGRSPDDPGFTTDGILQRADGVEQLIRWSHRALFRNGTMTGVASRGREMSGDPDHRTELVRRALDAEYQNREKTVILENISHEIRTPLNAMVGMAEILLRDGMAPDQERMVETIKSAGRQIAGLLDGMRDFDRLGRGTAQLDHSGFRCAEVIDEVIEQVQGVLDPSTQYLHAAVDPSAEHRIRGDKTRIQQVITNLVVNAIRHAGPARITISAELSGMEEERPGILGVTVSDTGRGINPEMQELIFDRFMRGKAAPGTPVPGMGLGLSISSDICLLHGGELVLQPGTGEGASFCATFQVEAAPEDRTESTVPVADSPILSNQSTPLHLLVAEDNLMNQEVLAAMLRADPVSLTFAANGLEAIEALKAGRFEAALIDIRMPLMDGLEFAAVYGELRDAGLVPDMLLVACSADPMVGRLDTFRDAGFQRALTKPITRMDLAACIDWIRERVEISARP